MISRVVQQEEKSELQAVKLGQSLFLEEVGLYLAVEERRCQNSLFQEEKWCLAD